MLDNPCLSRRRRGGSVEWLLDQFTRKSPGKLNYSGSFLFSRSIQDTVNREKRDKAEGKDVPDEFDELLDRMAENQLRANYRKSLGREYARRSWDIEIGKIFRKKE